MTTSIEITPAQLGILRHTLGLNYNDTPSRNFFHCGPEEGYPELVALKACGLMDSRPAPSFCEEGDLNFFATQAGKDYAMARQPAPIVKTVWDHFMESDMSCFTDFLGIEAPSFENCNARIKPPGTTYHLTPYEISMMPMRQFVRMVSPRGTGEWCDTNKSAKASYKADMMARKRATAALRKAA